MPPEHIHIISAGENIHTACPAAFRILPTITRISVFVDGDIFGTSPDPVIDKSRRTVRNAVESVREIAISLFIPYSRETVFLPAYPSVRDTLGRIHREFPGARFTFDLSGGSKPLCIALLAMSFWLDGEVYSAFDEKAVRNVPLPDRSVRSLLENPNYQTILAILLRTPEKDGKTSSPEWVARQYLFRQLWSVYIPSRTKKQKPEASPVKPVTSKKGRKPAAELTHSTFSGFMATLRDAGLVREETAPANRKEKVYRSNRSRRDRVPVLCRSHDQYACPHHARKRLARTGFRPGGGGCDTAKKFPARSGGVCLGGDIRIIILQKVVQQTPLISLRRDLLVPGRIFLKIVGVRKILRFSGRPCPLPKYFWPHNPIGRLARCGLSGRPEFSERGTVTAPPAARIPVRLVHFLPKRKYMVQNRIEKV